MSKLFKSSRVVIDDEAFVLSSKVDIPTNIPESQDEMAAKSEEEASLEAATVALEEARNEANTLLEEADQEAATILKKAEDSSERILQDAYEQAKGIMENAQEEGYKKGYDQGYKESHDEAQAIIDQALGIRDAWHKEREKILKDSEREIVELVLESLQKVLNKQVDEGEYIEGLVKNALLKMTQVTQFVLRVSPEDYNQAISIKPMILAMTEKIEDVEIRQDIHLEKGSCVVDSDAGSIDSGLWTQYEQIKTVFEDLLRSE